MIFFFFVVGAAECPKTAVAGVGEQLLTNKCGHQGFRPSALSFAFFLPLYSLSLLPASFQEELWPPEILCFYFYSSLRG